MRLYLLEDHELPLVHGLALIRTGNLFDPPDEVGLATMTGVGAAFRWHKEQDRRPVGRGTGKYCRFRRERHRRKQRLRVLLHAEGEHGRGAGSFQQLLTAPEFRQKKIDLVKAQLRSGISRRNDDPHEDRAARILRNPLRPQHALRLANGVRHPGPHRTRRPDSVLQAVLLSIQYHAGRLGTTSRQPK